MIQRVTGTYRYYNADGTPAYFKERLEPGRKSSKEFRFYHNSRQSGRGGDPILYRLPEVVKAKAVIFTEGEKQADKLAGWGLCGTTFDSGANSKFPDAMVPYLAGKRIAILRDNDAPGWVYAEMIAVKLHAVCDSIRIVLLSDLPEKGDLMDWNGDKADLIKEIRATGLFRYVPPPIKERRLKPRQDVTGDITAEMIEAAKLFPVTNLIEFRHEYAYCPWHKEDRPSLHHHAAKNRVKCFSCGAGGSATDLYMVVNGVSFPEAVKQLCSQ